MTKVFFADAGAPGFAPGMAWIVAIVTIWLVTRVIGGRWDRQRIAEYVVSHGGSVVSVEWRPLGSGCVGERGIRSYHVTYRTPNGKTVRRICKTGLFSGVYWTGGLDFNADDREAIECPRCRATIPPQDDKCLGCGWTYRAPN
jgi:hypothetical protein